MTHHTLQEALEIASKHRRAGRYAEAEDIYRQILQQHPENPDVLHQLGLVARQTGRLEMATSLLRRAVSLRPNQAAVLIDLGNALKADGQFDEAIAAYQRAIQLVPKSAGAQVNLGNALTAKGELVEAIAAYRQALSLRSDFPEALSNLGNALTETEALDEAVAVCRKAITLRPNFAEAHGNLGNALKAAGDFLGAIAAYRQAISIRPDYASAYVNLGSILKDTGQLDDSIAAFRQAIALNPSFAQAHSNLLLTIQYHPGYDAAAICNEMRQWQKQHAEPLKKFIQPHHNSREAERVLRLGYVSPDLSGHATARFLFPLLSNRDRTAFKVFCYSDVRQPNEMTARLKSHCDVWRNVVGVNDGALADMIRADQIDVLVDLTMHTAGNRLLTFARKPAPVQVAWLGYPGTTGLSAMDYRLTDPYLDPLSSDCPYSEKSIRLPDTFWCYDPGMLPAGNFEPGAPPCENNGFITFGCLNNFCKVNESVLELWSGVLNRLPTSRLLLLCPQSEDRQRTIEQLARHGIAADRVDFVLPQSRERYFIEYRRIDVGLDTLPYNGHTTTMDSLWMGVPVVTLAGNTAVGRGGASILSNAGLPELIAHNPTDFVRIACELAGDVARLAELRRTIRPRMAASPLMDAPKFVRNIEAAYRQMWRMWCQTGLIG